MWPWKKTSWWGESKQPSPKQETDDMDSDALCAQLRGTVLTANADSLRLTVNSATQAAGSGAAQEVSGVTVATSEASTVQRTETRWYYERCAGHDNDCKFLLRRYTSADSDELMTTDGCHFFNGKWYCCKSCSASSQWVKGWTKWKRAPNSHSKRCAGVIHRHLDLITKSGPTSKAPKSSSSSSGKQPPPPPPAPNRAPNMGEKGPPEKRAPERRTPPSKPVTAAMGPPSKAVVDPKGPPAKPAPTLRRSYHPDGRPNPWGDMA